MSGTDVSGYQPRIGDRVQWESFGVWLPNRNDYQMCVVSFDEEIVVTVDTDDAAPRTHRLTRVRLDERPEPEDGWDVDVTLPEPPPPYRLQAEGDWLTLVLNGEAIASFNRDQWDWTGDVIDALAPPEPEVELAIGQVWRCEVGGPAWTIVEMTERHVIYDLGEVSHMPRRVMTLDGFHAVKGELVEESDDE